MCHHGDVIIVGAGIIGLSLAWRLAQRGARVTILDRSSAAGEASWAAAGMLAPGGEFESGETARFAVECLKIYPEFVRELKEATGCPIDFRICGTLEIDSTADPQRQASNGIRSSQLDYTDASKLASGMAPLEGTFRYYPDDALVDPRETCHALLTACRALGVKVVENCEVQAIRIAGNVSVQTSHGTFDCDRLALAAGAWSSGIPISSGAGKISEILPGTFPVRGVLVGRRFPARTLGPFLRCGHNYILQRESGLAIGGATAERIGFDRMVSPDIITRLTSGIEALWPRFAEGSDSESWSGFRPASESGEPQIGRFMDTPVWLVYGHFRNGILMAPGTAARVAAEMTR